MIRKKRVFSIKHHLCPIARPLSACPPAFRLKQFRRGDVHLFKTILSFKRTPSILHCTILASFFFKILCGKKNNAKYRHKISTSTTTTVREKICCRFVEAYKKKNCFHQSTPTNRPDNQ